jgi:hypothetical protein
MSEPLMSCLRPTCTFVGSVTSHPCEKVARPISATCLLMRFASITSSPSSVAEASVNVRARLGERDRDTATSRRGASHDQCLLAGEVEPRLRLPLKPHSRLLRGEPRGSDTTCQPAPSITNDSP